MAKNREATIKFRADTADFQQEITKSNSKITELKSGVKLLDAEMNNAGSSVDLLKQKQGLLTEQLEQSRAKITALEGKLDVAKQVFGENSTEVNKLTTQLNNARAAEQRIEAQIGQTSAAIDAQSQEERDAASALSRLTSEISDQEKKVSQLANEYKNAVVEFGKTSTEAKQLESKLSSANNELKESKAKLSQAEQSADQLTDGLYSVGNSAEDAGGDLLDMAKNAAGIALAGAGVADIASYMGDSSSAASRLAAALGDTNFATDEYIDAMNEVYANNFGESFDDVAQSATQVAQIIGKDITPEQLESCTTAAISLRDTFDIDVSGSMKAAKVMMDAFGMSSDEAFDLLAKGAQDGLNINDDMVDSFAEYSPYFAQIGLDATDMFNAFASGADISMYGVDKAGDAFKEFGIRVVDGSESTKAAFETMGMNADEYAQKIMAGGDTAKQATSDIIKGLLSIEDPVQRNITGVSLFGTQWEDLGQDGAEAMLELMGSSVDAQGTLEDINSVRYDNVNDAIGSIGRTFETEFFQPLTEVIAPAVSDFATFFNENFDTISPIIVGVAVAFGVLAGAMAISGIINGVSSAFAMLSGTLMASPITWIVALIAALVAALVYLYNTNEDVRNFISGAWQGIQSIIGIVVDWFTTTALPLIQGFIDGVVGFFTGLGQVVSDIWNTMSFVISTIVNFIVTTVSMWLNNLFMVWSAIWNAVSLVASVIWNGISTTISTIINVIMTVISTVLTVISTVWSAIWNTVWIVASSIWEGIRNTISTIINGVMTVISSVMRAISSVWSGVWNTVWSVASNVWNGIRNTISTVINAVKSVVSTVVNAISSTISNVFNGIWGTVTSIWNGIKSAIMTPINAAKDAVSNAINAIKGFFSFNIQWPHIPMPHFGINPPGWQIGDLLQGKIPTLKLDFYASGGIMTRPTLFGMNGDRAMIGGEAGAEAILPITTLQTYIDAAFQRNLGNGRELARIEEAIERLDNGLGKKIAENAPDSYPGDRAFRNAIRRVGGSV